MLNPDFVAVLLLELPNEPRIPQLRRNAQVLTAAQQRVRLAALAGRWDGFLRKVLALASCLGDEPVSGVR